MAEGHGDSAPQGALKVALSGTLDRAGVLVGGSVTLLGSLELVCSWTTPQCESPQVISLAK